MTAARACSPIRSATRPRIGWNTTPPVESTIESNDSSVARSRDGMSALIYDCRTGVFADKIGHPPEDRLEHDTAGRIDHRIERQQRGSLARRNERVDI